MPAIRIRQSSLETARCLYRFREIYVLGRKESESDPAERGKDFHELAKLYVDHLRVSEQDSDWEYGEELLEERAWHLDARDIFISWYKGQSFDTSDIFATEFKIRLDYQLKPVYEDSDPNAVLFSADLDILRISGDTATIRDYKTFFGTVKPTTIQAILYAWLVFQIFPHLETVVFELEFVRWGILSQPREFRRGDLPMMDRFVKQQVMRLIEAIESNSWVATINSKCAYCRLACPLVQEGLDEGVVHQVQTPERAVKLAQELFALKRAVAQINATLKDWALIKGSIDAGNDMMLGFRRSNRWEFDSRTVSGLNVKMGFAPTRALKVDNQEIEKIGKQYPEYVDEAKRVGRDRSLTTFSFRNNVGDPMDMGNEEEF